MVTGTPELLHTFWGMTGATVEPLGGGMNSQTWWVRHEGSTYVAKQVSRADVADLVAGCEIASTLAEAGLATGAPVPTLDGRLVLTEHALALLEHVPGRELDGETQEEQRWVAETLAAVHVAGGPSPGPSTAGFATDWLSTRAPGLAAHPWVAWAIQAVRAETDALDLTWSVLHADPAPEAFVHDDGTGVTGLIDWSGARRGPVLYDVASAVMYLRGSDHAGAFLRAYQSHGPLAVEELELLDAFRRFRWAVQAAYFAGRLAAHDLTGIADQSGNQKGLDDARRGLRELGVE